VATVPASEPKNFDQVHDPNTTFILGDELFHWDRVWWSEYSEWVDTSVEEEKAEQERVRLEREKAQKEGRDPADVTDTLVNTFEKIIERIKMYLVDGDRERFDKLVRDPQKKVSMLQLNELATWLTEVQTQRPTQSPTPSQTGPGRTVPISPVASR
jgi:hypothetical protein